MEYLYFPKKSYYLTQGYGEDSYSHNGRKAIDVSAKSGYKEIYAPFSGYVARRFLSDTAAYTIWLVSNEKVMCADGKMHYAVMMLTHPKEIENFSVGQKFKVNDYLFNDGDTGASTGKHVDIEISIYDNKEEIKANWQKNEFNNYGLINAVDPCKYLILSNTTKVINTTYLNKNYDIIFEKEINKIYDKGLYKTLDTLRVRTGPGKKYRQKYVKELSKDGKKNATSNNNNALAYYRKNTLFDGLQIINNSNNDIWIKTYSGFVNIVDGTYVNCEKTL